VSAYDNDPRVNQLNPQNLEVRLGTDYVIVYYWPDFAVWRTEQDSANLLGLSTTGHATADEAIRSLIGDPQ